MPKFFIRYHSQTPVSFVTRQEEQENPKLKMRYDFGDDLGVDILNSYIVSDDDILHAGLDFDFRIEASDRDSALNISGDIADDLVSLIAFTANTEVADPQWVQAFQWDNTDENEFAQDTLVHRRPVHTKLSQLHLEFFKHVHSLIYSDEMSESGKRKLMRAFYHYRKSLKSERAEDEFLNLFIALDAIEYLLRDLFGTMSIEHTCGKCGEIAANDTDKASGRKSLYQESDALDVDFQKIRQARHQLFHAGKKEEAVNYIDELRSGFRVGVASIMGIDAGDYPAPILGQKTTRLRDPKMIFEGRLEDFDPTDVDGPRSIPAVAAELELGGTIDEEGRLNSEISYSIEKRTPNNETIVGEGIEYSYSGNIGEAELLEHEQY